VHAQTFKLLRAPTSVTSIAAQFRGYTSLPIFAQTPDTFINDTREPASRFRGNLESVGSR
jgi:hypothetical protein